MAFVSRQGWRRHGGSDGRHPRAPRADRGGAHLPLGHRIDSAGGQQEKKKRAAPLLPDHRSERARTREAPHKGRGWRRERWIELLHAGRTATAASSLASEALPVYASHESVAERRIHALPSPLCLPALKWGP